MKCPHCQIEIADESKPLGFEDISVSDEGYTTNFVDAIYWSKTDDVAYTVYRLICPSCENLILQLSEVYHGEDISRNVIFPQVLNVKQPPPEVPEEIAKEYVEAQSVLELSPRASAALSRRCLQHILKEHGGFKQKTLFDQIKAAINSNSLPSLLAKSIDGIRNIGNFAAHPIKSTNTGEIVDVEPGEAEWNIEVLVDLFDHYFVKPAKEKKRREELNKKLKDAGKPEMK